MIPSAGKLSKLSFGSNMDKEKVKSNSTYQKNMEKSFAVIYHNLQRIQATTTVARTRRHSQPEMPNPESSQRYPLIKKSNSVTPVSEKTNRKVRFSFDGRNCSNSCKW